MDHEFTTYADNRISTGEYAGLMASVGWGQVSDYDGRAISQSLAAYPFTAYARDEEGRLVGYVSAFSDGAFSTFIGELVVRPDVQCRGIGSELLRLVEQRYPDVPIYVHDFADVEEFFTKRGYRTAERPMSVVFKIPA